MSIETGMKKQRMKGKFELTVPVLGIHTTEHWVIKSPVPDELKSLNGEMENIRKK